MSALETLNTSRFWRCDPWNYNSSILLTFRPGGKSEMVYAYGQTVYAIVSFDLIISSPTLLQFSFKKSRRLPWSKGYVPRPGAPPRNVGFTLEPGEFEGVEANSGPSAYRWKLTLTTSPFPEELNLPRVRTFSRRPGYPEGPAEITIELPDPLIFFGHVKYLPGHFLAGAQEPMGLWRELRDLFKFLRPKS